jgi:hypothetical protein
VTRCAKPSAKLVAGFESRQTPNGRTLEFCELATELLWLRGRATSGTCSCGPGRRDRHCHADGIGVRKLVPCLRLSRAAAT